MAVSYGFYNSLNGDRKYNAIQVSSIFDGIILDGVFMSVGDKLMVTASSGMTVNIGIGRAWFDHTWTLNDAVLPVEISVADPLMDRIDLVVLDVNAETSARENQFLVLTGTPSINPIAPTLIREPTHNQYALAEIKVTKGVTAITQGMITNKVGLGDTPFVTGVVQGIDIEELVLQWESQYNEWIIAKQTDMTNWMNQQQTGFQNWQTTFRNEMSEFENESKDQFDQWFAELQVVLDGDVATNLFNKIDQHERDTIAHDGQNQEGVHGIRFYENKLQIKLPDGWLTVGGETRYGLLCQYINGLSQTCEYLESFGYTIGDINVLLEKD